MELLNGTQSEIPNLAWEKRSKVTTAPAQINSLLVAERKPIRCRRAKQLWWCLRVITPSKKAQLNSRHVNKNKIKICQGSWGARKFQTKRIIQKSSWKTNNRHQDLCVSRVLMGSRHFQERSRKNHWQLPREATILHFKESFMKKAVAMIPRNNDLTTWMK